MTIEMEGTEEDAAESIMVAIIMGIKVVKEGDVDGE